MLSLLQDMTAGKRFLVTFNGRAFDVSLLSARYILNRLEDPLAGMPHLDLLFPSRKLAGHRLENCRLVTLENEILGFTRTGDVPAGRFHPGTSTGSGAATERSSKTYSFTTGWISSPWPPLFLTSRIFVTRGNELPHCHPGDLLAAARLHLQHGDNRIARAFLEALMGSPDPLVVRDAGRTLSLFFKRQGRWEDAVRYMAGHDGA
jgi:hypothetical protein